MPFSHILGQDGSVSVLRRSLAAGKIAHAYLFDGIEGCGKKTSAIAFIEAVFCGKDEGCGVCSSCRKVAALQHPDLHLVEPDGAFIKIDQIRDLQRGLAYRPFEAPRKACIINAADRLNPSAGNALLKTLEEPPGSALIILVTANVGSLLPTIISRCQRLHFPALPQAAIEQFLHRRGIEPEAARVAASLAGGSILKAIETADKSEFADRESFFRRFSSFSLHDIAPLFSAAEELAADRDRVMGMLDLLTSFMRDVLLLQGGSPEVVNFDLLPLLKHEAARFSPAQSLERINHVSEARHALQRNVNPRLTLEVLFMRLAKG